MERDPADGSVRNGELWGRCWKGTHGSPLGGDRDFLTSTQPRHASLSYGSKSEHGIIITLFCRKRCGFPTAEGFDGVLWKEYGYAVKLLSPGARQIAISDPKQPKTTKTLTLRFFLCRTRKCSEGLTSAVCFYCCKARQNYIERFFFSF